MHVGMSVIFQNPGERIPDQQVYQQDLALALQAEGLGLIQSGVLNTTSLATPCVPTCCNS